MLGRCHHGVDTDEAHRNIRLAALPEVDGRAERGVGEKASVPVPLSVDSVMGKLAGRLPLATTASRELGIWGSTVNLSRHSVSRAAMGWPRAPPSTAAVTAPIEMSATAGGLNPGRWW